LKAFIEGRWLDVRENELKTMLEAVTDTKASKQWLLIEPRGLNGLLSRLNFSRLGALTKTSAWLKDDPEQYLVALGSLKAKQQSILFFSKEDKFKRRVKGHP